MIMCPETSIVMLLWLASLVFCFYGKAWVEQASAAPPFPREHRLFNGCAGTQRACAERNAGQPYDVLHAGHDQTPSAALRRLPAAGRGDVPIGFRPMRR